LRSSSAFKTQSKTQKSSGKSLDIFCNQLFSDLDFLIPAVFVEAEFGSPLITVLIILSGLFGKVIPPLMLTYIGYGRTGLQDYWNRLTEWRRISLRWWLISLLVPVITGVQPRKPR